MLEIKKDSDGEFRFVLKSDQGHALLESIPFKDPELALEYLDRLKPHLSEPTCFERKTDHEGQFQFTLRQPDGSVLGYSQRYRSEAGMENGIANTRRFLNSLD